MVAVLAARDLYMLILLSQYRKRTGKIFVVTFLGKAATFNLLYAFPFLLLSSKSNWGEFAHSFWVGVCDLGDWVVPSSRSRLFENCRYR
ncbi:MAG: hypothetical protein WDN07_03345 [Actinomycetota bacterium]